MIRCPTCQMTIPTGAAFCPFCRNRRPDLGGSGSAGDMLITGVLLGGLAFLFLPGIPYIGVPIALGSAVCLYDAGRTTIRRVRRRLNRR